MYQPSAARVRLYVSRLRGTRLSSLSWALILHALCAQATVATGKQTVTLSERASVVIETQKFVAHEHKLTYCVPNRLCLIDGHPPFGVEGGVPYTQITSLTLILDRKPIPLEHWGMFNPWSPVEGEDLQIRIIDDSPNGIRIRGEFSDGSAAYIAEWLVIQGGSARVLIDCVECVAASYMRSMENNPQ